MFKTLKFLPHFCIQTLTRHSWIHYTDCWMVYKHWPDTRESITQTVELYTNIDQTLLNSLHRLMKCIQTLTRHSWIHYTDCWIVYKHWPDTRESITQTVELYTNIDQTLVNSLHRLSIVNKHWPDTLEFITQTDELWNRWIRLSCYYNRV